MILDLSGTWTARIEGDTVESRSLAFPGTLDQLPRETFPNPDPSMTRWIRRHRTVGVARISRDIRIPDSWAGRRVEIFLEKVHIRTRILLDGHCVSLQDSLSIPHRHQFRLPARLPGQVEIEIDNRPTLDWEHTQELSEEVQGNWLGVLGRMTMRLLPDILIENPVCLRRDDRYILRVRVDPAPIGIGEVRLLVDGQEDTPSWHMDGSFLFLSLPDGLSEWRPGQPSLHRFGIRLGSGDREASLDFVSGLRWIRPDGTGLVLNGGTLFLRGTLVNPVFPLTAGPPMGLSDWDNLLRPLHAMGMNHLRFHSWCPPEAAFSAADRLGLLIQVEPPVWIGFNRFPIREDLHPHMLGESKGILESFSHHPSFVMLSLGNEVGSLDGALYPLHDEFMRTLRALDPSRLYTRSSGYRINRTDETMEDDYIVCAVVSEDRMIRSQQRFYSIDDPTAAVTDFDFSDRLEGFDRPVVVHEVGQWNVYPDPALVDDFTGAMDMPLLRACRDSFPYRPTHLRSFVRNSIRHMALFLQEEIEAILRTEGVAGYQLLSLQDYPGHGPAFLGFLDLFGLDKGTFPIADIRRQCGETVLLARFGQRILTPGSRFECHVDLRTDVSVDGFLEHVAWHDDGIFDTGRHPVRVESGLSRSICAFSFLLPEEPEAYRFHVALRLGTIENQWELHAIRGVHREAGSIRIHRAWSDDLECDLSAGRRVLLLTASVTNPRILPNNFCPPFWTFHQQAGATMGILADPTHPVFRRFPTESHGGWQWHDLLNHSRMVVLDDLGLDYVPIVAAIDTPMRNHKLGVVFEFAVGPGNLLVCALDLDRDTAEARQFRSSLLDYMDAGVFLPSWTVDPTWLRSVFSSNREEAGVSFDSRPILLE